MLASTFRSSSIPALRQPETNWLYEHDPEPAHVALAALAVAVCVDERVLDRLVRDLVARMARADEALGCGEDLLPPLTRCD